MKGWRLFASDEGGASVASRQSAIDTGDYDGRPLRRLHELAARPSL